MSVPPAAENICKKQHQNTWWGAYLYMHGVTFFSVLWEVQKTQEFYCFSP
jgi:hypothetical protein